MHSAIHQLVVRTWFQEVPAGGKWRAPTDADIRALPTAAQAEIAELYAACFGVTVAHPSDDELARFVHAISRAEFGFDSVGLLPHELWHIRVASAAEAIGWPVDRLSALLDWWYSSSEHREMSPTYG